MHKTITCIVCPRGCEMEVEYNKNEIIKVKNNFCKRGELYTKEEILSPKRVVTSTVKVINGNLNVIPVKTNKPIKKQLIFQVMDKIFKAKVDAPVKIGDIIIKNVDGDGTDIVATSNTNKKLY